MKPKRQLVALIALVLYLTGCATSYNSLRDNTDGSMSIIAADKADVLATAYQAISNEFPSANIHEIIGYQTGFKWFHMPMLDRTNFKLIVNSVTGLTADDVEVQGCTISIATTGTQGLVKSRYVHPLIKTFENKLLDKGIKKQAISKVKYKDSPRKKIKGDASTVSTGTGFFISNNGYIITNYHVVEMSNDISIVLSNGKSHQVRVVLQDKVNDIALLKADISVKGLDVITSSTIHKGEEVFALGYPLIGLQGQEQKATFGRINSLSGAKGDIRHFQVDVPIQPGNSGGPLINKNGQVVGIVTAMLSQLNTLRINGVLPQNVNYAIKSDYIIPVLAAKNISLEKIRLSENNISFSDLIRKSESAVVLVVAK